MTADKFYSRASNQIYRRTELPMILPYKMETTFARYPITNAAIISITSIFHFLVQSEIIPFETAEPLVLQEWNMGQLMGNVLLHGDIFHLIGNMLFLWIFGNSVCSLVGNLSYFFVYIFLGISASATHLFFDGGPAIGASGAINGIVGLTLIFFPVNKLHNVYFFSWPFSFPDLFKAGKFVLKTFWMILLWFVYDIFGVLSGGEGIAYWAHIGGFAAGIVSGVIILKTNLFETYDATIFDVMSGNVIERETSTLEELKAKEERKRPKMVEIEEHHEEPVEGTPPPFHDAIPVFRVLKVGRKDNTVHCYFINEGDKIANPAIQTSYVAEIQPSMLDTSAPGWITFATTDDINLENLHLELSFDAGAYRLTKKMKFDTAIKKFIVV